MVNKPVFLNAVGDVVFRHASSDSTPVIKITSLANGTMVKGFEIRDAPNAIVMDGSSNCTIIGNYFLNTIVSITSLSSKGNWILGNNFTFEGSDRRTGIKIFDSEDFVISNNYINFNYERHNNPNLLFWGMDLNTVENGLIFNNTLYGPDKKGVGISVLDGTNIIISENKISNFMDGIGGDLDSSSIFNNYLYYNYNGISFSNLKNCSIYSNTINDNEYSGIYIISASDNFNKVYLNRIVNNSRFGVYLRANERIDISNNWWGTNNPSISNGNIITDICISSQANFCDTWIVSQLSPSSYKVNNGLVYELTMSADLRHNNKGEDLSSLAYLPDGIPVDFGFGPNVNSIVDCGSNSTVNGIGKITVSLANISSDYLNIATRIDNSSIYTNIEKKAKTHFIMATTAIDISTGAPLSLESNLLLNYDVMGYSVIWKNVGLCIDELYIVVNDNIVLNKTVMSSFYYHNQNLESNVLEAMNEFNKYYYNQFYLDLASVILVSNPSFTNIDEVIIDLINPNYPLQAYEWDYVKAHHNELMDPLFLEMYYPGDDDANIYIDGIKYNFTHNHNIRMANLSYINGVYNHQLDNGSYVYKNSSYDGFISTIFTNGKVTNDVLRDWVNKKNLKDTNGNLVYSEGFMKAVYGSFLNSLLLVYCYDLAADSYANKYNVSWSRNTPVSISVIDNARFTLLTGNSDLRMGMDVVGNSSNVKAFRFASSLSFSVIEHWIMDYLFPSGGSLNYTLPDSFYDAFNGLLERNSKGSVVMDFASILNNNGTLEFIDDGNYLLIKANGSDMVLVYDKTTGIVRDNIGNLISGAYCYSDQQTEWACDLANEFLNKFGDISAYLSGSKTIDLSGFSDSVKGFLESANMIMMVGGCLAGEGLSLCLGELIGATTLTAFAEFLIPMAVVVEGFEVLRPYMADFFNSQGLYNLGSYYDNSNVIGMFMDAMRYRTNGEYDKIPLEQRLGLSYFFLINSMKDPSYLSNSIANPNSDVNTVLKVMPLLFEWGPNINNFKEVQKKFKDIGKKGINGPDKPLPFEEAGVKMAIALHCAKVAMEHGDVIGFLYNSATVAFGLYSLGAVACKFIGEPIINSIKQFLFKKVG